MPKDLEPGLSLEWRPPYRPDPEIPEIPEVLSWETDHSRHTAPLARRLRCRSESGIGADQQVRCGLHDAVARGPCAAGDTPHRPWPAKPRSGRADPFAVSGPAHASHRRDCVVHQPPVARILARFLLAVARSSLSVFPERSCSAACRHRRQMTGPANRPANSAVRVSSIECVERHNGAYLASTDRLY
jgi:hypothetical protein